MNMMRTILSDEAFEQLVDFCRENLKPKYDAETYARGFEVDMGVPGQREGVKHEIRGMHTKTGNPAEISFYDDADFIIEVCY